MTGGKFRIASFRTRLVFVLVFEDIGEVLLRSEILRKSFLSWLRRILFIIRTNNASTRSELRFATSDRAIESVDGYLFLTQSVLRSAARRGEARPRADFLTIRRKA